MPRMYVLLRKKPIYFVYFQNIFAIRGPSIKIYLTGQNTSFVSIVVIIQINVLRLPPKAKVIMDNSVEILSDLPDK